MSATNSATPVYAVTKCRDHWHVTNCGEHLVGEQFPTFEAANARANKLNSTESLRSEVARRSTTIGGDSGGS